MQTNGMDRLVGARGGGKRAAARLGRGVVAALLAGLMTPAAMGQVTPVRPGAPRFPAAPGQPFNPNQPNQPNAAQPNQIQPNPGQANPAEAGPQTPLPSVETGDPDMVSLAAFTEPVQLKTLIDLVGQTLHINITTVNEVPGSVVFNAPVPIKKSELVFLLNTLLEQQGYSITENRFGWYVVQSNSTLSSSMAGELATTQVIATPNLRPSSVKPSIDALTAGQASGGNGSRYSYVDDLGVIIATDSPARLQAVRDLVEKLVALNETTTFQRVDLKHIAASVARERALQLLGAYALGSSNNSSQQGQNPNAPGLPGTAAIRNTTSLSNLNDRLWVDPQGNALIFNGSPTELNLVSRVLDVIDVPNTLEPKGYEVGSSAAQIANIARERGLGEVISIGEDAQDVNNPNSTQRFQNNFASRGQGGLGASGGAVTGGPVMVVDERRGKIVYYGTATQQEELKALIGELDTQADIITTQVFKLKNSDSDDVADIINGLISNETPIATGALLGGDAGATRSQRQSRLPNNTNINNPNNGTRPGQNFDTADSFNPDPTTAFVISNKANNQVIVKARAKDQPQFARLIEQLDLRRPQVYVEARIIAVTASDTLRLAFEQQLINANGTGGLLNTNFGLSTFATGGSLAAAKTVATNLSGFTGAVIKNDQVPIVLNALATETDSKVISHPQLLVDDNEEANVESKDTRPTSTISRGTGGQGDIVTSGEDAEAGTMLTVTPQISEAGYLRLKYEIKLSSFTGNSTTVGGSVLRPPKQENTLKSDSVTVPSDCTVVVGGLVVDTKTKTINGVPILKDIPLLGLLFQNRDTGDTKTVLYIFITPKILREPNFSDIRLLTDGPQNAVGLSPDVPALKPSLISITQLGGSPLVPTPLHNTGHDEAPQVEPSDQPAAANPDAPASPPASSLPPVAPGAEQPPVQQIKPR